MSTDKAHTSPSVEEARERLARDLEYSSMSIGPADMSAVSTDTLRVLLEDHARLQALVAEAAKVLPAFEYLHIGDPHYDEGAVPVSGDEHRALMALLAKVRPLPSPPDTKEPQP